MAQHTPAGLWEAFPRGPEDSEGLTYREYFAGQALVGLAAQNSPAEAIAARAVALADATLAALFKAKGGAP